ncbi:MAG: hypothetical protein JST54_27775 [Deltaproteobacteria bacterium]|nr:hypothetical protein [Deltaproteobacteria bacterium]
MATAILERPIIDRPDEGRARWGGIFAGLFTGIGLWLLLVLLGTAIGLSALNPRDSNSWGSLGTGLGIWAGIAAIIATFFGAFVAGRLSGNGVPSHGVLHGVALWGFMSALTFYAGFGIVTEVVGTLTNLAGSAAGAVGSVVGQLGGAVKPDALADQANKYLQSQGRPPVPPEQLKAAISDLEQQAMTNAQNGEPVLDHEQVVVSLSQKTNLSRADAEAVASQVEGAVNQASQGVKQGAKNLGKTAENVGLAAVKGVRASVWLLAIALILNLGAAILGGLAGAAGTRRVFKRYARLPPERRPIVEEPVGPPLRPREV